MPIDLKISQLTDGTIIQVTDEIPVSRAGVNRRVQVGALAALDSLSKADVGLGNVDNTSDLDKPISTATQTALDNKLETSLKGAANGLAELDASGKVPLAQLPAQSNILSDGKFLIGNASNIATEKAISGDATVNNAGALTIAPIDLAGAKVTGILPNAKTTAEEFNGAGNTPFSIASRNEFGELSASFANVSTTTTLIPVGPDSSNNIRFPIFANTSGPSLTANSLANSNLTFNPSTGALSSTSFVGALTGNASTASTWQTARSLAGNSVNGSVNVPFANKFIAQGTTDTGLTNAQFLGALATGIVKNTTSTGVLSIANSGTDYEAPLTFSTGLTRSTNTVTVNTSQNIAKLSNLPTNGFVKTSATDGTLIVDSNTYLTTISGIAAGGDLSGIYTNPTVSKINGERLGTTIATSGNLLIGSGTVWETNPVSGDITLNSTGVTAIGANKVTDAKIRQSAALSVIGNTTNATANVADIAAASDFQVLRRSGTAIGFGSVNLASTNAVTGTLPVTNGGTGTATQFTQNSIVFAGVGGAYSQNNTKLNWNDTTFRLGVNTTVAPNFTIEAAGAIAASNGGTRSNSIAYDDVNNWGTITSIEAGVGATPLKISASNVNLINSNLIIETAGKGIQIKEGVNARMGQSTLGPGGRVTVANTSVTANSRIQLTPQANTGGGTFGSVYVFTRVAGVSFTIRSTSATDRRPVAWQIFEPAP